MSTCFRRGENLRLFKTIKKVCFNFKDCLFLSLVKLFINFFALLYNKTELMPMWHMQDKFLINKCTKALHTVISDINHYKLQLLTTILASLNAIKL